MKMYESNVKQLELLHVKESGEKKVPAKRVNFVSLRIVKESSILYSKRKISSPNDAFDLLESYFKGMDREAFVVVPVNSKMEPLAIQTISIGSVNATIVHPREVMKLCLMVGTTVSFFVFHNHPSGNPEPSQEDIQVTKRLVEAGKIMGIDLLDHIVIGDGSFVSLKEKGYV